MKKFMGWLKSFGIKMVINLLKSKTDVMAKKMADSIDIPFVSEKNEKAEAKKAISAIISLLEEICEDELKEKNG